MLYIVRSAGWRAVGGVLRGKHAAVMQVGCSARLPARHVSCCVTPRTFTCHCCAKCGRRRPHQHQVLSCLHTTEPAHCHPAISVQILDRADPTNTLSVPCSVPLQTAQPILILLVPLLCRFWTAPTPPTPMCMWATCRPRSVVSTAAAAAAAAALQAPRLAAQSCAANPACNCCSMFCPPNWHCPAKTGPVSSVEMGTTAACA